MGIVIILIIAVGFFVGAHALFRGELQINWFVVIGVLFAAGVVTVIGSMLGRNHSADRDTNGEIETRLNDYSSRKYHLYWMAKNGADVDAQIAEIDRQEAEFRKTIEYGRVTDGKENYYSYKGKR